MTNYTRSDGKEQASLQANVDVLKYIDSFLDEDKAFIEMLKRKKKTRGR